MEVRVHMTPTLSEVLELLLLLIRYSLPCGFSLTLREFNPSLVLERGPFGAMTGEGLAEHHLGPTTELRIHICSRIVLRFKKSI